MQAPNLGSFGTAFAELQNVPFSYDSMETRWAIASLSCEGVLVSLGVVAAMPSCCEVPLLCRRKFRGIS